MALSNLPDGVTDDMIDGGLHPQFYCEDCDDPFDEDDLDSEGRCPECGAMAANIEDEYEEDDESE